MHRHKTKKISALLLCLIMFALLATSVWAVDAATTEENTVDIIWRGAMNYNNANNQVTDTPSLSAANWTKMNWAYPLNISKADSGGAYYAGTPVIVGDYLYATGGGKLHKIDIQTGVGEAVVDAGSVGSNETDYLCYGGGKIFVATRNNITAYGIDSFDTVWSVGGDSTDFGQYHTIKYLKHNGAGYIWCNGRLYNADNGETVPVYQQGGKTVLDASLFAWSSGAMVGDYFYITDKYNVYAINMDTWTVADQCNYTEKNGGTSGQVAYDADSGRLFWGCNVSTDAKLYSIKVNAEDGCFVTDSARAVEGISSLCAPVIYDGRVYLAGQGEDPEVAVFVINNDSDTISLEYKIASAGKNYSNPILSINGENPVLYYYTSNAELYALEDGENGGAVTKLTSTPNYTNVTYPYSYEQIAMDSEGNIYCYNESGYLFSFGVSECEMPVFVDDLDTRPVKYKPTETDVAQALTVAVAELSDGGTIGYQWQSSTDKKEFTDIDGATDTDYIPDIRDVGTTYYRCKVTNTNVDVSESVYSRTAEICVKNLSDNTKINIVLNSSNALSEKGAVSAVLSGSTYNAVRADVPKNIWLGTQDGNSITDFEILQGADVTPGFITKTDGNELNGVTYDGYYRSESFTYPLVARIEVTAEDEATTAEYHLVVTADGEYTPSVYVTIVKAGEVVMAQQEVVVEDFNNDGAFTVDDALYAAHEAGYEGGAAAGYDSKIIDSDYGSNWGITKLWGDTSGAYGYWLNNASCWSLGDEIFTGDHLAAFVYQNTDWSDAYSKFDEFEYATKTDSAISLEVTTAGYDENWATVWNSFAEADIKAYDSNMELLGEDDYNVENNGSGKYSVTFTEAGTYYLIAESADETVIVPAVCRVVVEAVSGNVYVTISDAGNIVMAQREVTVIDRNADGKLDVDEALYAAHEAGYPGGAAEGYYSYDDPTYGRSLGKLWGNECGNYGYWLNNAMCFGLGDEVFAGDHLVAFVYQSTDWSDAYSKFDKFEYTAKIDSAISLEMTTAGYGENWETVWNSFDAADIKAYDSNMQAVAKADYTVKNNGSGKYSVTFAEAGTYYLIAESANDTVIVPAVCRVMVSAGSGSGGGSGTVAPTTITISFSVETHKETWLAPRDVTLSAGATVADAFHKVMKNNSSFKYSAKSNYVISITYKGTTLGEFDMGKNSGWKYRINDVASSIGMDGKTLNDGDELVWYYVVDYTEDTDRDEGGRGMGGSVTITTEDRAAANEVKDLIAAIGKVDENSKDAIKAARQAYDNLTDAQKDLVKNLDVLKAAEQAYAALTGEVIAPADMPFADVEGHWAADAIAYVADKGLMTGESAHSFAPELATSRAMIAAILYRLSGSPEVSGEAGFADVVDGAWYADAVRWAEINNVVSGYVDGGFGPNDNISREQLAAILYRYAAANGRNMNAAADLGKFDDADSISGWALTAMQWANAEELITGKADNRIDAQGKATRAEVATILMRYLAA